MNTLFGKFRQPELSSWRFLAGAITLSCLISDPAIAQMTPDKTIAQVPNGDSRETLPPQDIIPPTPIPPLPTTPSSSPAQPEELLPLPTTPEQISPTTTEETITVTEFIFTGNTAFSQAELAPLTANLINQPLPLSRLLQIASDVARLYADKGYVTSGATISIPQVTRENQKGEVEIKIIEGELEEIKIFPVPGSSQRLQRGYIRSRLQLAIGKPLNLNRLQEALQLLQLDPLIATVSATLTSGSTPDKSILEVIVAEARSFTPEVVLANDRPPSVGSFRRGVTIREANLFGLGDGIRLAYSNTDGKDEIDVAYQIPWNPRNGTIGFAYNHSNNQVIEPPFDQLDIKSNSDTYELTLRQPVIQTIKEQNYQEFILGLTTSLRDSASSLANEPYPLSPGANRNGETRVFALRFFQEYSKSNAESVFALRSQLNFGLDAFGSTVNQQIPGVERIPDSRFFAWRFQGQYVRLLGRDSLFLFRTNGQIADQRLLSSEQFSLGGLQSVRGYRQDQLLTDNGIFLSVEAQLPIFRVFEDTGVVQIIPFIDYGTAWNSSGIDNPRNQTLSSVGLGLQWRQGNNFSARLDWGIPLVDVNSRKRTWQENGIYFNLRWALF